MNPTTCPHCWRQFMPGNSRSAAVICHDCRIDLLKPGVAVREGGLRPCDISRWCPVAPAQAQLEVEV